MVLWKCTTDWFKIEPVTGLQNYIVIMSAIEVHFPYAYVPDLKKRTTQSLTFKFSLPRRHIFVIDLVSR